MPPPCIEVCAHPLWMGPERLARGILTDWSEGV